MTHFALRVQAAGDETTWKHTADDLDAIAPPLTRILNRYDATRAAAAAGDEISLMAGLAKYAGRNYIERRRLIAAVQAEPDQPTSGAAAEPGTGPDDDDEYGRVHDFPPNPVRQPRGPHGR